MRNRRQLLKATTMVLAACALWPAAASAATLHVCGTCAYTQLGPALAAAHNGDTIKVASGTYPGGITIDKSVTLVGAGSSETIIKGGGPGGGSVLTLGAPDAVTEPTISISGVTITGGVAHSSTESTACGDQAGVLALGGGIDIPPKIGPPPNCDFTAGSEVTISDSVITENQAAPTRTLLGELPCVPGQPCCPPDHRCPYALAGGGGIDNWGQLTLKNSAVTNNTAAGIASDADGGGISSYTGSLTLLNTTVTGNNATATDPNGRFAEGGGVFVKGGTLTIQNSDISHNTTSLTSSLISPFDSGDDSACPNPCHIDMGSNGGAIHVSDGVPTTISGSTINDNSVAVDNPSGEANPFDAAMNIGDSPFVMRDSTVSGNRVSGTLASTDYPGPGGSVMELDGPGTITDSNITDNPASEHASGDAAVNGGVAILPFGYVNGSPPTVLVADSRITGNSATATAGNSASALGGGFFNNGNLELRNDTVTGNSDIAHGTSGVSQGAGIWNGVFLAGPPVALALRDTNVTDNTLAGDPGIALQGAGLFTDGSPLTLTNSRVEHNTPDQCYGC